MRSARLAVATRSFATSASTSSVRPSARTLPQHVPAPRSLPSASRTSFEDRRKSDAGCRAPSPRRPSPPAAGTSRHLPREAEHERGEPTRGDREPSASWCSRAGTMLTLRLRCDVRNDSPLLRTSSLRPAQPLERAALPAVHALEPERPRQGYPDGEEHRRRSDARGQSGSSSEAVGSSVGCLGALDPQQSQPLSLAVIGGWRETRT